MERSQSSPLASYIIGFALSLLLTGTAYLLVTRHALEGGTLIAAIVGLAIAQVASQLVFFLHLGQETKPRWKLLVLASMLVILGILVFGSLWIMQNLNYNMNSENTTNSIIKDEGIH